MREKRAPSEEKVYSSETIDLAKVAVEELVAKGYDKDSVWRFAKAAKSWCTREAQDFLMWEFIIRQMGPEDE